MSAVILSLAVGAVGAVMMPVAIYTSPMIIGGYIVDRFRND
jgi:hypothetical protein